VELLFVCATTNVLDDPDLSVATTAGLTSTSA